MANHISHSSLPYPIKNARFTILVPYLDADGDPTDPTTPDTEVSQDGGAFADAAEEMTTISGSNGVGYITLTGAETNNSAVAVAAKVASGPKATLMTLYPRNLPILASGTASAGASGSITLASSIAYDITGCFVRTTGGTGGGGTGGASNQARRITAYNTGTQVATVTPNWETTPDATTTYDILLPEGVTIQMVKALNPTTAGRTLDVSSGGEAGLDWANIGSPTTAVDLSGTSTKALEPTTAGRKLDVSAGGEAGLDWANIGSPTTAVSLSGTSTKALEPTTAGRTLDVTATGEAGIDWANIGGPTTTVNLSGTTVKTATDVETDTQDIQGRLPAALGANGNIKADVRDYSGTAGTFSGGRPEVNTVKVGGTTQTAGDLYATLLTIAGYVDTEVAAILAAVDTEVAAIKAKTDLIPGTQDGKTFAETVVLMAAALLGKASGLAGTTAVYRAVDDSKDRITATVAVDGNRSAVTLDPS